MHPSKKEKQQTQTAAGGLARFLILIDEEHTYTLFDWQDRCDWRLKHDDLEREALTKQRTPMQDGRRSSAGHVPDPSAAQDRFSFQ